MGDIRSHLEEEEREDEKDQARYVPISVTIIVKALRIGGRKASWQGDIIAQFKILPPAIAPKPKANIGNSIEIEGDSN